MKTCPELLQSNGYTLKFILDTQLFKERVEILIETWNFILCVQMPA